MIRAVLLGWVLPVGALAGWYGLAANDISFGTLLFSRAFLDEIFALYGGLLGIDPAILPTLVAHAILLDSLIVLGLVALRHHRRIARFVSARLAGSQNTSLSASRSPESLSSAP